jgi:hypothetical protein
MDMELIPQMLQLRSDAVLPRFPHEINWQSAPRVGDNRPMVLRPTNAATDIRGRRVRLGAHVRVLKIAPWLLVRLDVPDKLRVRSMVGQVFRVEEIDQHGHPWVSKDFPGNNLHSLALDASEMELVLPNKRGKRTRRCTIAKRY